MKYKKQFGQNFLVDQNIIADIIRCIRPEADDNMVEIGTVGLTATDQGVVVVNSKMKNVPQNLTKDWPLRTPGNGRPETWFFSQ